MIQQKFATSSADIRMNKEHDIQVSKPGTWELDLLVSGH